MATSPESSWADAHRLRPAAANVAPTPISPAHFKKFRRVRSSSNRITGSPSNNLVSVTLRPPLPLGPFLVRWSCASLHDDAMRPLPLGSAREQRDDSRSGRLGLPEDELRVFGLRHVRDPENPELRAPEPRDAGDDDVPELQQVEVSEGVREGGPVPGEDRVSRSPRKRGPRPQAGPQLNDRVVDSQTQGSGEPDLGNRNPADRDVDPLGLRPHERARLSCRLFL